MTSRLWIAAALAAGAAACGQTPPPAPKGPTNESINAAVTAKIVCSGVFVSGRSADEILRHDIHVDPGPILSSGGVVVRQQPPAVIVKDASGPIEAVYRNDAGCTLIQNVPESQVYRQFTAPRTPAPAASTSAWPAGEGPIGPLPRDVNQAALDAAMNYAFSEPSQPPAAGGAAPEKLVRGTRAVAVAYKGHLLAERYAPPYTQNMPLLGYSMTKSLINTLTGILVKDGKVDVAKAPIVPEWPDGDPRRAITLDEMLHMSSGLQFVEQYSIPPKPVDVVLMLYASPDAAHLAADKPLANPPGSVWQYSSGTTNLISRSLREAMGGPVADWLEFPKTHLFDRIGAYSAVMEPDTTGTFVGSTFTYATARDWARLGQLYLNDGMWNGERLLPEGWVKYTTTPTPKAPTGRYGAQFWLNAGDPADPAKRAYPSVPTDMYAMIGYLGQAVVIVPSEDLVVVRLGETTPDPPDPGNGDSDAFSLDHFVAQVIQALPKPPSATAKK